MSIYGHSFTELKETSKAIWRHDRINLGEVNDRNNWKVQKAIVYIQNCSASCTCQWNVDWFLVSHNERKPPCTVVIAQRRSSNILQWYSPCNVHASSCSVVLAHCECMVDAFKTITLEAGQHNTMAFCHTRLRFKSERTPCESEFSVLRDYNLLLGFPKGQLNCSSSLETWVIEFNWG